MREHLYHAWVTFAWFVGTFAIAWTVGHLLLWFMLWRAR